MIRIKKPEEIDILREGGKRLARILKEVSSKVAPGVAIKALDAYAAKLITDGGDTSAFLDYQPQGAKRPFPASLCVSINDEVVHGIPNERDIVLQEGDIVSLDLGLIHDGFITDHAITVPVGAIADEDRKLLEVTRQSLMEGIKAAKPGGYVGDIGAAIAKYVEKHERPYRFGIIEVLCGHGVGYAVHEDPFIPNIAEAGTGPRLRPGMVIAIEPMLTTGGINIKLDKDGYTYRTRDASRAAHFEHTVAITEKGPEILTLM